MPEWAAAEENLGMVSRLLEPLVKSHQITDEEKAAYYYNFSRTGQSLRTSTTPELVKEVTTITSSHVRGSLLWLLQFS